MKKCETCKIEKNESSFCKDKRKKDSLCGQCRECLSKRKAKYRKENLERCKKIALKSYHKNHERTKQRRREWIRKWREENREESRKKGREAYHKNVVELRKRRNERNKTPKARKKVREYMRWRRKEKPSEQMKARMLMQHAIRKGFLKRPIICEKCMKECKPDGHHKDYSKPLEVQWLCKICHFQVHNKLLDVKP